MPQKPKKISLRTSASAASATRAAGRERVPARAGKPCVEVRVCGKLGAWTSGLPEVSVRLLLEAARSLRLNDEHEISLVLCDGPFIRRVNRKWRGKDQPTDVLSFPIHDLKAGDFPPPGPIGDIIVCLPRARRDARELGAEFTPHLALLLCHGLLHLVGYDHVRDADYRKMKVMEQRLLAGCSV